MINTIEKHLNKFRETHLSYRVIQYDDMLVYKVGKGCSDKAAKEANDMIEELKLPLVTIPTTLVAKDCFVVKSSEVEL